MSFISIVEDFTCEQCGARVAGNGYTNHCTACLWSKHVDVFPGDRAEPCGGAMEPVGAFEKRGTWRIAHHCTRCAARRSQTASPRDRFEALTELAVRGQGMPARDAR